MIWLSPTCRAADLDDLHNRDLIRLRRYERELMTRLRWFFDASQHESPQPAPPARFAPRFDSIIPDTPRIAVAETKPITLPVAAETKPITPPVAAETKPHAPMPIAETKPPAPPVVAKTKPLAPIGRSLESILAEALAAPIGAEELRQMQHSVFNELAQGLNPTGVRSPRRSRQGATQ